MSHWRVWLCWSASQQAFHIENEADGLKINLRAFTENRPVDFVPIAIFASRKSANKFTEQVKSIRDRRQRDAQKSGGAKWN